MLFAKKKKRILFFCPKCLFPESIVWYILMGTRFLFNSFLMQMSHQDQMINNSSYMSKPINVEKLRFVWLDHVYHLALAQNDWTTPKRTTISTNMLMMESKSGEPVRYMKPIQKKKTIWLVGGFNPSEKYWPNLIISPRFGVKIKHLWNHYLDDELCCPLKFDLTLVPTRWFFVAGIRNKWSAVVQHLRGVEISSSPEGI